MSRRIPFVAVAIIVLITGLAIRLWTARNLTLLPNADSWDYLAIAEDLRSWNWASPRLGDFRLPAYPVFLAVLREMFGTSAFALLLAQASLGLLAALAVARSVFVLSGASAAILAGLCAALHPVYLVFEHQVMTETLFVATLSVAIWIAATALRRGFRPGHGIALGVVAGANLLTRANAVVALAVLGAALGWFAARPGGSDEPGPLERRRRFLRFGLGGLAGVCALLLPWLLFMESRFGQVALVRSEHRNRLAYLALHRILDPSLPGFAPFRAIFDRANPGSVYDLVATLTEQGASGERTARELVREQLEAHPEEVARARFVTALEFVGLGPPGVEDTGRGDVRYWFVRILPDRETLGPVLESFSRLFESFFPGSSVSLDRHGSGIWSAAGAAYLSAIRRILLPGALALGGLAWFRGRRRSAGEELSARRRMIGTLTLAIVATIGLHAGMLASLDRFAVSFDALAVVLLALALVELVSERRPIAPRSDYRTPPP